ncbi:MAG: rhomboid family intramembrane serine protease [Wenzhouxiangellaceae bacterium]|nr:rhomboid family intramembrane serine protease [Wenzhouxiangellaceae bacterium]
MRIDVPDPDYTASKRSGANFVLAFKLSVAFLVVTWSVFLFDQMLDLGLVRFGLRPRDPVGLLGLVTTPLLHFDLRHIGSNTLPLLVGGTTMLFLYPNSALRALPIIFFGSALLTWLFARDSIHIGASGVIYGILGFVFVSGVIRRDLRSICAAMLVWFLYGSMVWGILPSVPNVSWELHASGLLLGVVTAVGFAGWDRPPMKRYDWEDEREDERENEPDADFEYEASLRSGEKRPWQRDVPPPSDDGWPR